jgi:putative FmdB family regulatory protein
MPIYEYTCTACGHRFEKLVRVISGSESKTACPNCGEDRAQRAVSAFAVAGGASPVFEGPLPSAGAG